VPTGLTFDNLDTTGRLRQILVGRHRAVFEFDITSVDFGFGILRGRSPTHGWCTAGLDAPPDGRLWRRTPA